MARRFRETQDAILYEIYEFFRTSDSDDSISEAEIVDLLSGESSRVFTRKAVEGLVDLEYLDATDPLLNRYQISAKGIEYVEKALDDETSFICKQITQRSSERQNENEETIDGNFDVWEPLKIDRAAPEFTAAVEAVEQAIDVVQGDNGYANSEPEERGHIVWSLTEGIRAIKEQLPSYEQVRSLLVAPLTFLTKKFAETVIGEATKAALGKIIAWLATL